MTEETSTQRESFLNEWKGRFSHEETFTNLFYSLDFVDYEFGKVDRVYQIGPDRVGAVVNMKEGDRMVRIIIDLKHGKPSYRQMLDVVYGMGADCDKNIVLFDGLTNVDDARNPSADRYLIESFTRLVNEYGVDTSLVRVSSLNDPANPMEFEYTIVEQPEGAAKYARSKPPSRRKFEEVEFWVVYYDSLCGFDTPTLFEPEYWLEYTSRRDKAGLVFTPTWTDRGFFMHAIVDSDSGVDTLNWLWDHRYDEIHEEYKGCEIRLHKKGNVPHKISVRINKIPFTQVILSTPQEKEDYAGELYFKELDFANFLASLIHERESEKKAMTGS